jgi:hypothetical protein
MSEGVTTQFVWFYIPGPKQGWELQHSIASVRKHFQGTAEIVVIGAHPGPWFTDTLIEVPRIGKERGFLEQPYWDTRNKWRVACLHTEIKAHFVWMMDDQFFVNPVTAERLQEPKADPFYKKPVTKYAHQMKFWHKLVMNTFEWLEARFYHPYQFATHAPHWIVKNQMLDVLSHLPEEQIILPEIVYGTAMCDKPGSCFPFLKRVERPVPDRELDRIAKTATVVNLIPGSCTHQIMRWIEGRLS